MSKIREIASSTIVTLPSGGQLSLCLTMEHRVSLASREAPSVVEGRAQDEWIKNRGCAASAMLDMYCSWMLCDDTVPT